MEHPKTLGFEYVHSESLGCRVSRVHKNGPLDAWNDFRPERAVMVGDEITHVMRRKVQPGMRLEDHIVVGPYEGVMQLRFRRLPHSCATLQSPCERGRTMASPKHLAAQAPFQTSRKAAATGSSEQVVLSEDRQVQGRAEGLHLRPHVGEDSRVFFA